MPKRRFFTDEMLTVGREILKRPMEQALIEVWHILDSKKQVVDIKWHQVRTEEHAIVFEDSDYPSWGVFFKEQERSERLIDYAEWVEEHTIYTEIARHTLTVEAEDALLKWYSVVHDWCVAHGKKLPQDVFVQISGNTMYPYINTRTLDDTLSRIREVLYQRRRNEAEEQREAKIAASPEAQLLRDDIMRLERELAELRHKLDAALSGQVITSGNGEQVVLYGDPIEKLDLPVRVFHALKRTGIQTIPQLIEFMDYPEKLLSIRNFGEKSRADLEGCLAQYEAQKTHVGGARISNEPLTPEEIDHAQRLAEEYGLA